VQRDGIGQGGDMLRQSVFRASCAASAALMTLADGWSRKFSKAIAAAH